MNEDFDHCPSNHVSEEEVIHREVAQENGEGSNNTSEEQVHQVTEADNKMGVDVSEDEKETHQLNIIPESLPVDKGQVKKGESDVIKTDNSMNEDDSNTAVSFAPCCMEIHQIHQLIYTFINSKRHLICMSNK